MTIDNSQLATADKGGLTQINADKFDFAFGGRFAFRLSTINYQLPRAGTGAPPLPTLNRERAPDARTTTLNYQLSNDIKRTISI
ncbi:MAG: hypothetical protein ACRC62_06775 [Microcoleus sp.]